MTDAGQGGRAADESVKPGYVNDSKYRVLRFLRECKAEEVRLDAVPAYAGGGDRREQLITADLHDVMRQLGEAEADRARQAERIAELIEQVGETKGESHERLLRIAELEADLAAERATAEALTEPTEYGQPGFQWAAYHDGLVEEELTPTSETAARRRVAGLRHHGVVSNALLLRRPFGAWERWPLTPEEADEMAPAEPVE